MKLNKAMAVLAAAMLTTSFASLADVNSGTVTQAMLPWLTLMVQQHL